MAVGFGSYDIPRSGLFVNERALYVTGHNISNVNTKGYVRQQAMITSAQIDNQYGMRGNLCQVGLGSDIEQIRQIRHAFLDNIYRQENTNLGYWQTRNKTLEDVQSILGEPMGSGLQNVMNQFWDSWQELSKSPDSLTVRALVRQRGEAFVQHVNHVGSQLDKLQDDLNTEVKVRVEEINDITKKIANLNVEVLKVEISKDVGNDYRDQRNSLLDRLSKLCDAEFVEMQDGQVDVVLAGNFLVRKGEQKNLYASWDTDSGMFYKPVMEGTDIFEVPLNGGIIKGLMESRGEVMGAKGSIENGMPNTMADITFVVDNSVGSADNLSKIKSSILNYVNELKKRGTNFNLRLATYSDTAGLNTTVWNNANIDNNASSFVNAVNSITEASSTVNNFEGVGGNPGVVSTLSGINYRDDANKYAVVFTHESLNGNEGLAVTDAKSITDTLNASGIKLSVITGNDTGTPAGEVDWSSLTSSTGGKTYGVDSATASFDNIMTDINSDINNDVNKGISILEESKNIISDLRKRLNALVNVVAREVNYAHRSGKTLNSSSPDGDDFFTVIDSAYPIQMGNIRLNGNLNNLDNIVASGNSMKGDNTIALKISGLRNNSVISDNSGPLNPDDYYQSIILKVGNSALDAKNITDNQDKLVTSADNYRLSIMSVSMDEEMSNMMKYKFAYDASSKAINIVDQMLDIIINRMGNG